MSQSSTLYIGMDVHKDSIAVAYVAQEHGEVMDTMKIHILLLQKPNAGAHRRCQASGAADC